MNKDESSEEEFEDAKVEEVEDTLLATSKRKRRPLGVDEMNKISQNVNPIDLNESIVSIVQGKEPMAPIGRKQRGMMQRTNSKVSTSSTGANAFGANFFR